MFRGQTVQVRASFASEHIDVKWSSLALFWLQANCGFADCMYKEHKNTLGLHYEASDIPRDETVHVRASGLGKYFGSTFQIWELLQTYNPHRPCKNTRHNSCQKCNCEWHSFYEAPLFHCIS